jgi:hypothetical protein
MWPAVFVLLHFESPDRAGVSGPPTRWNRWLPTSLDYDHLSDIADLGFSGPMLGTVAAEGYARRSRRFNSKPR